jgi:predicted MPP superfamily phosphohydrolase
VAALGVVVVAFLAYSYAETYRVEVKVYTFSGHDVPPAFDGLEIAFLSDVHRSWFFRQARVERIVDRVNALGPDLVLLGGDYVYGGTDYERPCFEALGRLHAPLGVFAALGNHDYGADDAERRDLSSVYAAVKQTDIVLLRNEGVWLRKDGARLRLGAVADLKEDVPHLAPALDNAQSSDLVILVSHNPDFAEQLPPEAVDLMLSGHTHGGQVTFFGLWAPLVPSQYGQKYRTGMVTAGDDTTVIVSNGLGVIFPPLRFFARPQIVVVTLERGP